MEHALLAEGSPSPHLQLHEVGGAEGDSSSGSSETALGALPDPVSAQLINNITMLDYRSLGNTSPLILNEEELSKSEGVVSGVSACKLPNFVSWNWNVIRAVLFWGVCSAFLACLTAVIAIVAVLPNKCNPEVAWYQGSLFYEVFPASFKDSNGDGIGDIRGLTTKIDYIERLGVRVVRLNSIFKSEHYPENYKNATTLIEIDKHLGTLQDLTMLVSSLHKRNLKLVLDLPIHSYIDYMSDGNHCADDSQPHESWTLPDKNNSNVTTSGSNNVFREDKVSLALKYWVSNGIDGFYLKGIESLVEETNTIGCLKSWKNIIGPDRVLIVSYEAVLMCKHPDVNILLDKVDLIDVYLDVSNSSERIKEQVDQVMKGILWSKPGCPWVHWNVGSVESRRLSSIIDANYTLPAILLNMMLPGTPSIFYGDEISLKEISSPEEDFHESRQIHNLMAMAWGPGEKSFTSGSVLPWAQGEGRSAWKGQERTVMELAQLRLVSPSIYVNAIWRDGIGIPNAQVRNKKGILIIERWSPRKNSFILVLNMGKVEVNADLSSLFYGGTAVVATARESQGKQLRFKSLNLKAGEAILIKLDK